MTALPRLARLGPVTLAAALAVIPVATALTPAPASAEALGARDLAAENANLDLVRTFYIGVFEEHRVAEAAAVLRDDYIQHNPNVPNGKAPFVDYFTGYFAENPQAKSTILRAATMGDLVFLHVLAKQDEADLGQVILDILRVEDGMIAEHWDVIQDVPETTVSGNPVY